MVSATRVNTVYNFISYFFDNSDYLSLIAASLLSRINTMNILDQG